MRQCPAFVEALPSRRYLRLWEPRPRGDSWWSATVIATRASLLQGDTQDFCEPRPMGSALPL